MTKVGLPISEETLQSIHEASRSESLKAFEEQHFGRHHAKKSVETLDEDIEKVRICAFGQIIGEVRTGLADLQHFFVHLFNFVAIIRKTS